MVDAALNETLTSKTKLAAVLRSGSGDTRFRLLTGAAAVSVLLVFAGLIVSLTEAAMPAIKAFGLDFFTTETWNAVTNHFGALASIYGTIMSSLLAMLIAVPVGIGIAIFLTEICPRPLRRLRRPATATSRQP